MRASIIGGAGALRCKAHQFVGPPSIFPASVYHLHVKTAPPGELNVQNALQDDPETLAGRDLLIKADLMQLRRGCVPKKWRYYVRLGGKMSGSLESPRGRLDHSFELEADYRPLPCSRVPLFYNYEASLQRSRKCPVF